MYAFIFSYIFLEGDFFFFLKHEASEVGQREEGIGEENGIAHSCLFALKVTLLSQQSPDNEKFPIFCPHRGL